MSLALIAALPFLGALLPGLAIRAGRDACALVTGSVTALALVMLGLHAPAVLGGETIHSRIDWMPALGLNANFFLDGLGLLFAGLILGIGLLIILYARYYLAARDPMGRFFSFLLLFQGAMLGLVLSDNILLLLVFWELTSLSSFLLIGYWKHLPEARQGARMALTVTGLGGLSLIAGLLILGQIAGSHDLSEILRAREAIQASGLYLPALLLILIGCFAKSAQFPFHFWLPHAMAAPTPVSAYLHSATMVKAGLFLMARLWPVLAGTPEWTLIVTTTGLLTMVMAAKIALFKDDLKALLAFSTVSQLGLVTMLLGLGSRAAALAAIFHILNHATFKAALFMSAGIIDHETHTRDLRRLGGLRRLMPLTFAIATLAALSMAGVPPLNGFLSKEMMLEETLHAPWLLPVLATLGAAFSVAYSLRFIAHTFLGPVRHDFPHPPHDPGAGLWAAPALLVLLALAIGLWPMAVAGWLVDAAASATIGAPVHAEIAHWHGLTPALALSLAALGGGAGLLALHRPLMRLWQASPRPEAKRIFDGLVEPLARAARRATAAAPDRALSRALAAGTVAILAAGALAVLTAPVLTAPQGAGSRALTPIEPVPAIGWLLLVVATLALVRWHHDRFLALILIGVVGLVVSMGFAYLSAPDLALTQILVEVATVILLLLALNFLPRRSRAETSRPRRLRDLGLASAAGLGAGGLIHALMLRDPAFPSIAGFHLANARTGGGGANVVNVILVDFRGFDTFGEISVLAIAALVIFALTATLLRSGRALAALAARPPAPPGDSHPLLFVVATRLMLPAALMVGVHIFLRGHNLPGGGFIAGLVVSIALLMQYMASGHRWSEARKRIDHHALIGAGVLLAGATGMGSWLAARPFLTSAHGHLHLPLIGDVELATAMIFDAGVFLAVLGAVMLALASLSRLALRPGDAEDGTGAEPARDEPKGEH